MQQLPSAPVPPHKWILEAIERIGIPAAIALYCLVRLSSQLDALITEQRETRLTLQAALNDPNAFRRSLSARQPVTFPSEPAPPPEPPPATNPDTPAPIPQTPRPATTPHPPRHLEAPKPRQRHAQRDTRAPPARLPETPAALPREYTTSR